MSNQLLSKHLKRQKKDLYQEVNKYLKKFNDNESKINSLKDEITNYEVALETYSTMFPNWEYLENIDDDLFNEINGFVKLIDLTNKQIEILNKNNEDLKNLIKTIQGKIVSINVDLGWIRDDEYE